MCINWEKSRCVVLYKVIVIDIVLFLLKSNNLNLIISIDKFVGK